MMFNQTSSPVFLGKTRNVHKKARTIAKTIIQAGGELPHEPQLYGSIWDPGIRKDQGLLQVSPTGKPDYSIVRTLSRSPISKKQQKKVDTAFRKHLTKRLTEIFELKPGTLKRALEVTDQGMREQGLYQSLYKTSDVVMAGQDTENDRPIINLLKSGDRPFETSSANFSLRSMNSNDESANQIRKLTKSPNHVRQSQQYAQKDPDFKRIFHNPAVEYARTANRLQQVAATTKNPGLAKIMFNLFLVAKAKEEAARRGTQIAGRVISDTLERRKKRLAGEEPLPNDLRGVKIPWWTDNYGLLDAQKPLSQIKDDIIDTAPSRYPEKFMPIGIEIKSASEPQASDATNPADSEARNVLQLITEAFRRYF